TPTQFRDIIRSKAGKKLSDSEIDAAWMEYLLDVPDTKLNLLLQLRKQYRLFLLSNTNAIHIANILSPAFEKNGHAFSDYFEKAYYSHELHCAKPDRAIFEQVLLDAAIRAEETLFIDDGEANIATAAQMGFVTYLAKQKEDFSFIFTSDFLEK
ncbi:MAG: HAD-IA family hydrolase, partial [Bacteroidales bacterium]|nr:HAD-IA family hydrolase [Bacteroidales bacterium]